MHMYMCINMPLSVSCFDNSYFQFQEMPLVCSSILCSSDILSQIVSLLSTVQEKWSVIKKGGGATDNNNTPATPL